MKKDIIQLRRALTDTLSCLESWMEIAEKNDDRDYDHEAVAQAKATLIKTRRYEP